MIRRDLRCARGGTDARRNPAIGRTSRLYQLCYCLTTSTGQRARRTTRSETLPSKARRSTPRPRLPRRSDQRSSPRSPRPDDCSSVGGSARRFRRSPRSCRPADRGTPAPPAGAIPPALRDVRTREGGPVRRGRRAAPSRWLRLARRRRWQRAPRPSNRRWPAGSSSGSRPCRHRLPRRSPQAADAGVAVNRRP